MWATGDWTTTVQGAALYNSRAMSQRLKSLWTMLQRNPSTGHACSVGIAEKRRVSSCLKRPDHPAFDLALVSVWGYSLGDPKAKADRNLDAIIIANPQHLFAPGRPVKSRKSGHVAPRLILVSLYSGEMLVVPTAWRLARQLTEAPRQLVARERARFTGEQSLHPGVPASARRDR
jgi:hypothetical protein